MSNNLQAKRWERIIGGKKVTIETGKMAQQAGGAVLVSMGETQVLVTATASKAPRPGIDFFPLLVDYEEKMYAAGRIPGSFMRREARPSDAAILTSRLIDRPLRPLFPKNYRNDVQIVATPLSVDGENQPDILAIIGASAALTLSSIPFEGPVGAIRMGRRGNEWLFNPTFTEVKESEMDMVVAGTKEAVLMVEAGISILPEAVVLEGIAQAYEVIKEIVAWQEEIRKEAGKEKLLIEPPAESELAVKIKAIATEKVEAAFALEGKEARNAAIELIKEEMVRFFEEEYKPVDDDVRQASFSQIYDTLHSLEKTTMRKMVIEQGKRADGRGLRDIRPISVEAGLIFRTHGSALFTRGETQVLSLATLGSVGDEQELDNLTPYKAKRYLHHYNFPAYSTGEVKPSRGPGRREIGHGALAERALLPVLPSKEEFPYTLRVVSEAISSNGSTSMASTCGSSLALMDAGVPIKAAVGGCAMGLIKEGDKVAVLTDIQGMEDHLGDMDFKVTGTREGITALQMDMKIKGITLEIMKVALEDARLGRLYILDKMDAVISKPRPQLSPYAPRIITIKINPAKIGTVIGPGGKMIREITETTGVQIDIEDDGTVLITTADAKQGAIAKEWVEDLVREVEVGKIYKGKVVRLMNFGAFVEVLPGKDGLVHISHLAKQRVAKVEDVVKVGDEVVVRVLEIDDQGRVNLTMKDL